MSGRCDLGEVGGGENTFAVKQHLVSQKVSHRCAHARCKPQTLIHPPSRKGVLRRMNDTGAEHQFTSLQALNQASLVNAERQWCRERSWCFREVEHLFHRSLSAAGCGAGGRGTDPSPNQWHLSEEARRIPVSPSRNYNVLKYSHPITPPGTPSHSLAHPCTSSHTLTHPRTPSRSLANTLNKPCKGRAHPRKDWLSLAVASHSLFAPIPSKGPAPTRVLRGTRGDALQVGRAFDDADDLHWGFNLILVLLFKVSK